MAALNRIGGAEMKTMDEILEAMSRNRIRHGRVVMRIRRMSNLDHRARSSLLAECWFRAMRTHYRLLEEYILVRQMALRQFSTHQPQPRTEALRAPDRPRELPESTSRYILVNTEMEWLA